MRPTAAQIFNTQLKPYPKTEKKAEKKTSQKFVEIPVDREEIVQSIEFLTNYMEDLKAGRPVENLHPDNDPWFLIPENIAIMIESDKSMLNGKVMGRVIENVDDLWKELGIE